MSSTTSAKWAQSNTSGERGWREAWAVAARCNLMLTSFGMTIGARRIVTDRETGKPRGFGFIEFFDIPTAESAIRNLSGKDFNGRTIR